MNNMTRIFGFCQLLNQNEWRIDLYFARMINVFLELYDDMGEIKIVRYFRKLENILRNKPLVEVERCFWYCIRER